MKKTFKLEAELPLKYHGTFALIALEEGKTVNEILVDILTNDWRVKRMQKQLSRFKDPPNGDFGIRPHPDSPLRRHFK